MFRYETVPPLASARLIVLLLFLTIPGTWAQKRRGQNSLQTGAVLLALAADAKLH